MGGVVSTLQTSVSCCCPSNTHQNKNKNFKHKKNSIVGVEDLSRSSSFIREPITNKPNIKKNITFTKDIDIKAGDYLVKKTCHPNQDYETLKELGEGAFGQVWSVKHKKTGDIRAIKIIAKDCIAEGIEDSEIENEINILKGLDHNHIIKVYEFYDHKENIYIVQELAPDGDLYQRIEKLKIFNENLALRIMQQLFAAIKYLHSQNVVHGDIKPENIMIDNRKGKVVNSNNKQDLFGFDIKLIDFGTSKIFDKSKVFDTLVGTSYYVAPEVVLGSYHRQCDLWSCGVILYVLLTGTFPFDGETDEEIFEKIKEGDFNMDHKQLKKVSKETNDLLENLLLIDPLERISSLEALEHKAFDKIKSLEAKDFHNVLISADTKKTFIKMKTTSVEHKFQQAITTLITHNFLSKDLANKYREMFKAIDKDGDGRLTKDEMMIGYKEAGFDVKEEEIQAIISGIDKDNSGYIEVEEFISASIDKNVLLSDTNLQLAFDIIDDDNSGFITFEEVGKFIGGGTCDKELIKQVIEEVGKHEDDHLTFDDFKDIMNVLKDEK